MLQIILKNIEKKNNYNNKNIFKDVDQINLSFYQNRSGVV